LSRCLNERDGASTEPAVLSYANPETASAERPFNGAPRFYTECEKDYLCIRAIKDEEPTVFTRPASLSQQEADAYFAFRQARFDAEEAAKNPRRKKKGITLQAVACPSRVPHTSNLEPST